jgi:hypothetical protein
MILTMHSDSCVEIWGSLNRSLFCGIHSSYCFNGRMYTSPFFGDFYLGASWDDHFHWSEHWGDNI